MCDYPGVLFSENLRDRLLAIASTYAQVVAVDFGGDYTSTNLNALRANLVRETGDYDFDGVADDRSATIPLGTGFSPVKDKNFTQLLGKTKLLYWGAQIAVYNTTLDPDFSLLRLSSFDLLQFNSAVRANTTLGMASAIYSRKEDFLNGTASNADLRLVNAAGSLSLKTGGGLTAASARFLIRAADTWYVSASSVSSIKNLSINGAMESWYALSPTPNLLLNLSELGNPTLGSDLNDITAFGVYSLSPSVSGDKGHAAFHSVSAFTATLEPAKTLSARRLALCRQTRFSAWRATTSGTLRS